ncbi:MAG: 16S rRNA (cytidine(1402)-2'-O)-methyltransferase [Clostridia bacterium]|nr:16S rRNA (cytidine(1402)-2'-O)-methyltransferase [Clostridia bacterium]
MSENTCGRLYVTGTPIGNLSDFSPRALETLETVDFIAAEDTRVTLKLLNHFSVKTPMVSYHEHNKNQKGPEILDRILRGENCALVTDAGMPAISDPGQDLVDLCLEHGVPVVSVPGPTAFATALALSGMDSRRFLFEGFLEVDKKTRREQMEALKGQTCTLILYEAPHKLSRTLKDLLETLGDRRLCICRELTKVHEEVLRTTLAEAVEAYPSNDLKGELVLILEGASKEARVFTLEEAVAMAKELLNAGVSKNDAAKEAAKTTGLKKGDIYRELF